VIIIKLNKEELSSILGITKESLKKIETKGQLEQRLNAKGYILKNRLKEGRNIYYIIELENENKEVYSNMCEYVYNVKKETEFTKYFTVRTSTNGNELFPLNCADIGEVANVSSKTVKKWDNTLEIKDIIRKDGFYYFSMELETKEIKMCSKQEYLNFWKNKALLSALNSLQIRYIKGEITLTELQLSSIDIGNITMAVKGKYYYRTKKYATNKDNKLYIDTLELIKALYGNKDITIEYELIE